LEPECQCGLEKLVFYRL